MREDKKQKGKDNAELRGTEDKGSFWGQWLWRTKAGPERGDVVIIEGCDMMKCCVKIALNLMLDGVWAVMSDPFSFFQSWSSLTGNFLRR